MSDLTVTDLRPEVLAFALAMERELRAAEYRRTATAERDPLAVVLTILRDQLDALERVVTANTNADGTAREPHRMTPARQGDLMREIAGMGCAAFFVGDVFGLLGPATDPDGG